MQEEAELSESVLLVSVTISSISFAFVVGSWHGAKIQQNNQHAINYQLFV